MKALYLTVGLPYSGKSTWAKKQGMPIVNPDSIRLALHGRRYTQEAEDFVWAIADDYLEDGKFDAWFWIEGNYGCDCNRSIALYGLEVDESMPCNNGDNIIVIDKIVDAKTQKTLYIPEIAKE